jgi:NDP-sugar pyrophosphorylase family protein
LGILQKKHFQSYDKETKFDLAEIYEDLSNSGKLFGFEIKERFYEIGSFQGIHELTNFLKPQKP